MLKPDKHEMKDAKGHGSNSRGNEAAHQAKVNNLGITRMPDSEFKQLAALRNNAYWNKMKAAG